MAREETHRLSKLLRYILYECLDEFVIIKGEINFITNYIDLMKIRYGEKVIVDFSSNIDPENHRKIPPLLFIPLIENAFKHGVNGTRISEIKIIFKQSEKSLSLFVSNSNKNINKTNLEPGGIGINNVKKRLKLLYNSSEYSLSIEDGLEQYSTELTIPIYD
jgi:LytS/YehU family sensor histidine kinase